MPSTGSILWTVAAVTDVKQAVDTITACFVTEEHPFRLLRREVDGLENGFKVPDGGLGFRGFIQHGEGHGTAQFGAHVPVDAAEFAVAQLNEWLTQRLLEKGRGTHGFGQFIAGICPGDDLQ